MKSWAKYTKKDNIYEYTINIKVEDKTGKVVKTSKLFGVFEYNGDIKNVSESDTVFYIISYLLKYSPYFEGQRKKVEQK